MPSDNVEFITRGLQAFEQRGLEGFLELAHPEFEVYVDPEMANADEFSGHEGFMDWSNRWFDAWSEIEFVPREPIEVSDSVVIAPMIQKATGAGSGIEVEMEIAWVFRIDGGMVTLMHLYKTVDRAVAAAERIAAGT